MSLRVVEVKESTPAYASLLAVAEHLDQARYVAVREAYSEASVLLGAFDAEQCLGFLRFVVLVIGRDCGRSPIISHGQPLREGFVEAFGVLPDYRRQGIGQGLQERAITLCQEHGCYQIRSRSPITSHANYALKLKMGYAIQPSHDNDAYYFIKTLVGS